MQKIIIMTFEPQFHTLIKSNVCFISINCEYLLGNSGRKCHKLWSNVGGSEWLSFSDV